MNHQDGKDSLTSFKEYNLLHPGSKYINYEHILGSLYLKRVYDNSIKAIQLGKLIEFIAPLPILDDKIIQISYQHNKNEIPYSVVLKSNIGMKFLLSMLSLYGIKVSKFDSNKYDHISVQFENIYEHYIDSETSEFKNIVFYKLRNVPDLTEPNGYYLATRVLTSDTFKISIFGEDDSNLTTKFKQRLVDDVSNGLYIYRSDEKELAFRMNRPLTFAARLDEIFLDENHKIEKISDIYEPFQLSGPNIQKPLIGASHFLITESIYSEDPDTKNFGTSYATEELYVERYPVAKFPEIVNLGEIKELEIKISIEKPKDKEKSGLKIWVTDQKEIPIIVTIYKCPNFEIKETSKQIFVPKENKDSNTITFYAKAIKLGKSDINIRFEQNSTNIGEIQISSTVISDTTGPSRKVTSTEGSINISDVPINNNDRPDLEINIRLIENGNKFYYEFSTKEKDDTGLTSRGRTPELDEKKEQKLTSILNGVKDYIMKEDNNYLINALLESLGKKIFKELTPKEFQEYFWYKKDKFKTIYIVTDDPYIPWELLKPTKRQESYKIDDLDQSESNVESDDFICKKYSLSRWQFGKNNPWKLTNHIQNIKNMCLIMPDEIELQNKSIEDQFKKEFNETKKIIEEITKEMGIENKPIIDPTNIVDVIKEVDMIQFTSHNTYDENNPTYTYILINGNEKFYPMQLEDILLRKKPIVIMNACQTARQNFSIMEIEGWVNTFITNGATGFIGTLWPVTGEALLTFTKNFYKELKKKISISEAFKTAKIKSVSESDPLSSYAFVLYCYPNAKIIL